MTGNLFRDFAPVCSDASQPEPTPAPRPVAPAPAPNAKLTFELASARIREQLPPSIRDDLHPGYLNQLARAMMKRGKFTIVCCRCGKGIDNPSQQHHDKASRMIYGVDCWEKIQQRQLGLTYHYHVNAATPAKEFATDTELTSYICATTGQEFRAVAANVPYCGGLPRACSACSGTAVRNRHRPCDFEQAIRLLSNGKLP